VVSWTTARERAEQQQTKRHRNAETDRRHPLPSRFRDPAGQEGTNTRLSTPSTISMAISVASAAHAAGSSANSIRFVKDERVLPEKRRGRRRDPAEDAARGRGRRNTKPRSRSLPQLLLDLREPLLAEEHLVADEGTSGCRRRRAARRFRRFHRLCLTSGRWASSSNRTASSPASARRRASTSRSSSFSPSSHRALQSHFQIGASSPRGRAATRRASTAGC